MIAPAEFFSDVEGLLDRSRPGVSRMRFWQAGVIFLAMVVLGGFLGRSQATLGPLVDVISGVILASLVGAFFGINWSTVRRFRRETAAVQAIEELVQLRYWPQAAVGLRELLSQPMNLPSNRCHALMLLGGVLNRYNLFDSALRVQQSLIDDRQLDPFSEMTIRLSRAATLLREDRLFDADRAIVELRRQIIRIRESAGNETPAGMLASGLTLVELYRDVKTGHPNEAIELFAKQRESLREHLGHRLAEALVLVARAHAMIGQSSEAASCYRDATTLQPAAELHRRYPETASLASEFAATPFPMGAA